MKGQLSVIRVIWCIWLFKGGLLGDFGMNVSLSVDAVVGCTKLNNVTQWHKGCTNNDKRW